MPQCVILNFNALLDRLPEVPPDTAETNTLMDVNNLPEWSKITPSSVYRACGKLSIQYETRVSEHCETLQGNFTVAWFVSESSLFGNSAVIVLYTFHLYFVTLPPYCIVHE